MIRQMRRSLLRRLGKVFGARVGDQSAVGRIRAIAQRGMLKAAQAVYGNIGGGSAYPAADPSSDLMNGLRPAYGGSNALLVPALDDLIRVSRHIERATPTGRAAAHTWVADLVGSGIAVEPMTGDEEWNAEVREAFNEWAKTCTPEADDGPTLWELQSQGARELFSAGALLWRIVIMPSRLEQGLLPLAILPLEIEWLAHDPVQPVADGLTFVRGKELDRYGRAVRYHLRNPDEPGSEGEVVDASMIIHAYERRRPRMAHGEPELAPVATRVIQDDDLVSTELRSALNGAATSILVTGDAGAGDDGDTYGTDPDAERTTDASGKPLTNLPAGAIAYSETDGTVTVVENKRPSQDVAKFRGTIRGDLAGGTRVSQQGIDRDAGRSSYTSLRGDQQQTVKLMGPLQRGCVGRQCASKPFALFAEWYSIGRGYRWPSDPVARRARVRHRLRPDVPAYVDPVKDAIGAGLMMALNLGTLEEACAARGRDVDEVIRKRAAENKRLADAGLQPATLPRLRGTSGLVAPSESDAGDAGAAGDGDRTAGVAHGMEVLNAVY
jgi:capsid protein